MPRGKLTRLINPPASDQRGRVGPRYERRVSHSHHHRRPICKSGGRFIAHDSGKAEERSGYNHQTYAQYAANFRKAKANGTMSGQPAPEYLQGAVIGLNNETGGILVLVGGRDFEHNQYDRALQAKRPAGTAMKPFVYAAAFEKGMYPGSVVEDGTLDNRAS